jgi:hypothetical protein
LDALSGVIPQAGLYALAQHLDGLLIGRLDVGGGHHSPSNVRCRHGLFCRPEHVQSLPVALISGRALNGMARQFRADTFEKAFFG